MKHFRSRASISPAARDASESGAPAIDEIGEHCFARSAEASPVGIEVMLGGLRSSATTSLRWYSMIAFP
jgi:hypothetical protein